ncbi:MAG: hypothetical protein ACYTF4_17190 [Planctomycetota bacterium]
MARTARPPQAAESCVVAADVHALDFRLQGAVKVDHLADVELVLLEFEDLDQDPDLPEPQGHRAARSDGRRERHVAFGGDDPGPLRSRLQRDLVKVHRGTSWLRGAAVSAA